MPMSRRSDLMSTLLYPTKINLPTIGLAIKKKTFECSKNYDLKIIDSVSLTHFQHIQ